MTDLPGRDKSLDPDGYIYVIQFSTGHIKVGQTNNPRQRLSSHTHDAAKMGAAVSQFWFSAPHRDYRKTESRLIDAMSAVGRRLSGREYYADCDFAAAVQLASGLIGRPSTPEERSRHDGQSFGAHIAQILMEKGDQEAKCQMEHLAIADPMHLSLLRLLFEAEGELPTLDAGSWTEISDYCDAIAGPLEVESDAVLDLSWIDLFERLAQLILRSRVMALKLRAIECGRTDLVEPLAAPFMRSVQAELTAVSA